MPTTVAWIGNGQNIAQVDTFTVTGVANGGTLSITINGKSVTYTCTGTDTTTTAATSFKALLAATNVPPEFQEITWANPSAGAVTGTAKAAGTPFTTSKSQAGGATATLSTTTANSSQSDVNNAANWNRAGAAQLPQNGDDMVLANTSVPLLWNLNSLSGVLLNSFTRYQSFTGSVGLPENNPLGYVEYRPTDLKLGSNVTTFSLTLGPGSGSGPSRERYDMQFYRTALLAMAAGNAADHYSIRFRGTHGSNTLLVIGCSVGVSMLPTDVGAQASVVNLATVGQGGTCDFGPGCTFSGTSGGGTLTLNGGTSTVFCTPSVAAYNSAQLTLAASGGVYASITAVNGVSITVAAAMTISSLTLAKSSSLSAQQNLAAITVTTSTMDGDTCTIIDPNNTITFTNPTTENGGVTSGPIQFTGPRTMKIV